MKNGVDEGEIVLPVLVEATTALLRQMLGPNVDGSTLTEWSLDVTDGSDDNHWRSLKNGDGLNDLLLVDLCESEHVRLEFAHQTRATI